MPRLERNLTASFASVKAKSAEGAQNGGDHRRLLHWFFRFQRAV
jgi:hypothetical protein